MDLSLDLSLDLGLDPDLDLKIRTELPPAQVRLFSRRSHSINRFTPNAAPRTLRFSMRMLPLDGSLGSDDEGGPAQVSAVNPKQSHMRQYQQAGRGGSSRRIGFGLSAKGGRWWWWTLAQRWADRLLQPAAPPLRRKLGAYITCPTYCTVSKD